MGDRDRRDERVDGPEAQPAAQSGTAFYLDGPLYYLGRELPGVLDVVLLRAADTQAALLFRSYHSAQQHLARLPEGTQVHTLEADDFRAKEEVLRAAALRGALELWLDVDAAEDSAREDLAELEPAERYPLARALDYVLSFKRQSACL